MWSYRHICCWRLRPPKFGSCLRKHPKTPQLILVDGKLKLLEIAEELKLSEGSVFTILHEHLSMRKLCGCRICPQSIKNNRGVRLPQWVSFDLINWGCKRHQLHLCRGVRLPQWVSCDLVSWDSRRYQLHFCREVRLLPMSVLSMAQIELFKNQSYLIELCAKKKTL